MRAWVVALAAIGLAVQACAAGDTTFYSGPELGARLLNNVVRIRSLDSNEHGFGLVVGAQARHVFIATARHVVLPRAPAGTGAPVPDPAQRQIEVSFCAGDDSGVASRAAQIVDAFDAGGHDIALLRVPRPAGYTPQLRSVAVDAEVRPAQETWLLGQAQQCGVAARSGAIASLRDARENLRIEFPGALGGNSGGPALSGYGVLGLVTDAEDLTFTLFSIASLETRLRAQSAEWWQLLPAHNIPLTDPRSAQVDLSETLNQYLFGVRNLQQLLLQAKVPQARFVAFANEYNAAVNRFRDARERHDGTLKRHWPEGVLAQWQVLRDQLWQVHQPFWNMNAADSQAIFDRQSAPPAVQERMRALEPELVHLQAGIADFLKTLAQGVTP
jgi:hypothetical protein